MTMLRQTYIAALLEAFSASTELTALAAVERSVINAMGMSDRAVIVAHRGGERKSEAMTGAVDRFCELLVTVVTRDAAPDVLADQVMEIAHPLVMSLTGTNLVDVSEADDSTDPPVFAAQDGSLCLCTTHYIIQYRSGRDDLTR
ncbi:conserved hypothetical protein [Paraburkholderia tropica]